MILGRGGADYLGSGTRDRAIPYNRGKPSCIPAVHLKREQFAIRKRLWLVHVDEGGSRGEN